MQSFHRLKRKFKAITLVIARLKPGQEVFMGTFQNVSRTEPCAICGKTDWCSVFLPDKAAYQGQKMYVCRRISSPEIQSPLNSKTYYFIKEFNDTSCLYSDVKNERDSTGKNFEYKYRSSAAKEPPVKKIDTGIPALSNHELDLIYRTFLKQLTLSKAHLRKLHSDGWTKELILQSGVKSLQLPKSFNAEKGYYTDQDSRIQICNKLLESFSSLRGVPGFYQDTSNQWTFSGKRGILFPIRDRNNYIYRLRLRLDRPELDEKGKEKNKYKNFSSYYPSPDSKGNISNAFLNGCRAGSKIGFFYHPETDDSSFCIITEGEKKAYVANHLLKCIVISVPGVNSYAKLKEPDEDGISVFQFLHMIGCNLIAVAYDADKYINEKVLQCEQRLIKLAKEESFKTSIATWNPGFGKGLDDILALGIIPEFVPV